MGTQPDEMTTGGGSLDDVRGTTTKTGDAEAHIEVVEAEIVETRDDLADTVRQIGERLEPANLAREARESVTGAAMGKVEQMQMGAQETWRDVRSGNAGGILDMVKENPVPAGMVGLGLAMLLMNRGSKGSGSSRDFGQWQGGYRGPDRYGADYRYSSSYGNGNWDASGDGGPLRQAGDKAGDMAATARDAIGGAAGSIGDRASQMADSVGEMASDLPDQASQMWDQGYSQAQRFMRDNPLGAGLIAMAAGAAIGMLVPTTSFERENIAPMRDQVVDKAANAAEDAIDSVTAQGSAS